MMLGSTNLGGWFSAVGWACLACDMDQLVRKWTRLGAGLRVMPGRDFEDCIIDGISSPPPLPGEECWVGRTTLYGTTVTTGPLVMVHQYKQPSRMLQVILVLR